LIRNIIINSHKVFLGGSKEIHETLKPKLSKIIKNTLVDANLNDVFVYNMEHDKHNHDVGSDKELYIFINAALKSSGEETVDMFVDEETLFLPPRCNEEDIQIIYNGFIVAEYNITKNQLNILFNLFPNNEKIDERLAIFEFIIKEINNHFVNIQNEKSWFKTNNKAKLLNEVEKNVKQFKSTQVNDIKVRLENAENEIEDFKAKLKRAIDKVNSCMKMLNSSDEEIAKQITKFINDLDILVNFSKITDLQIEDSKVIIYTVPLTCYASNSKKYNVGSFKIEIDLSNAKIRFFGDTPKESYWSANDPHPHIDGRNGKACLGNIESTVAEFCSSLEIYPLCLLLIDYLESANVEDSAGRNVTRWEEVK